MTSAWQNLADQIADNSKAPNIFALSTMIGSHSVGMDCLQIASTPSGSWGDAVGVFHVSPGVGPNNGRHSWLYVATASSSNFTNWTVQNGGSPYSQAGSQGYIRIDPATQNAYLAYELEMGGGNTVAIRRYNNINSLVNNSGAFDEFQLSRQIHVAAVPNTWTPDRIDVTNVGTPSLDSFSGGDVSIRCHYSPDGNHDYPAEGFVSLGSQGIVQNWGSWVGVFSNWVSNALVTNQVSGKVGSRDMIMWGGSKSYIFEAQLIQDDWGSWRPFLVVPEQQFCTRIDLRMNGNTTFANPHMALFPNNRLVQTYFVPSERNGKDLLPGTYLRVTQLTPL